ncbi:hypothetical protein DFQ26_002105 [Actinomortierella ambigua]|nr:hypothetical protein DFQ26_002105 [Actinomortierella ambigua]
MTLHSNTIHFSDLPPECLTLIVNQIPLRDLYRLLTVNRAFFKVVVRKLYEDPINVLGRHYEMQSKDKAKALQALFSLLARCLPAADQEILYNYARMDRPAPSLGRPYVPYTQLIQTLSLEHDLLLHNPSGLVDLTDRIYQNGNHDLANNLVTYTATFMLRYFCIFRHRFPTLQQVGIPCSDMDRYQAHIHAMSKVETVYFGLTGCSTRGSRHQWQYGELLGSEANKGLISVMEEELRQAADFFVALAAMQQKHRQSDPANIVHRRASSSIAPKQLDARLVGYVPPRYYPSILNPLRRFFKLLPIIKARKVLGNTGYRCDYGSLSESMWHRFYASPYSFNLGMIEELAPWLSSSDSDLDTPWPQENIQRILRQCRSLKLLSLNLDIVSSDVFEWAVQESLFTTSVVQGSPPLPRVALQELNLTGSHALPMRKVILDAAVAFPSLCTLKIIWHKDETKDETLDLRGLLTFPNLRTLDVDGNKGVLWNSAIFNGLPHLKHLKLDLGKKVIEHLEPCIMDGLESLELIDAGACSLFHPQTIASMTQLRRLVINCCVMNDVQFWHQEWAFPNLEYLHLRRGCLQGFHIHMVGSSKCPKLTDLYVNGSTIVDYKLEDTNLSSLAPFGSLPSVKRLVLISFRPTTKGYEKVLPAHFPNLQYFATTQGTTSEALRGKELRKKYYVEK